MSECTQLQDQLHEDVFFLCLSKRPSLTRSISSRIHKIFGTSNGYRAQYWWRLHEIMRDDENTLKKRGMLEALVEAAEHIQ